MHRIDTSTAVDNKFVNGNAASGIKGTQVDESWLNSVQEELCGVVEEAGLSLNKSNNGQLASLLSKQVIYEVKTSSGTLSTTPTKVSDTTMIVAPGKILDLTISGDAEYITEESVSRILLYYQLKTTASADPLVSATSRIGVQYGRQSVRLVYKNTSANPISLGVYLHTSAETEAYLAQFQIAGVII